MSFILIERENRNKENKTMNKKGQREITESKHLHLVSNGGINNLHLV